MGGNTLLVPGLAPGFRLACSLLLGMVSLLLLTLLALAPLLAVGDSRSRALPRHPDALDPEGLALPLLPA